MSRGSTYIPKIFQSMTTTSSVCFPALGQLKGGYLYYFGTRGPPSGKTAAALTPAADINVVGSMGKIVEWDYI